MSDLRFEVRGVRPEPYAIVPTLILRLGIREMSGARIGAVGLKIQVQIESQRRHYDAIEEARLFELFGEPARWGETLRTMLWTHLSVMVPAFEGATEVDVPLPCSADIEIAATKYFGALDDGDIPLLLQFSGSVFAATEGGIAFDQVRWNQEASCRIPVRLWRDLMAAYHPDGTWIRVRRETYDALQRFKAHEVITTWDETMDILLLRAGADEREPA